MIYPTSGRTKDPATRLKNPQDADQQRGIVLRKTGYSSWIFSSVRMRAGEDVLRTPPGREGQ